MSWIMKGNPFALWPPLILSNRGPILLVCTQVISVKLKSVSTVLNMFGYFPFLWHSYLSKCPYVSLGSNCDIITMYILQCVLVVYSYRKHLRSTVSKAEKSRHKLETRKEICPLFAVNVLSI